MLTIPATGDEVATARWEERRRDGAVRYAKAAAPQKILSPRQIIPDSLPEKEFSNAA